MFPPNQQAQIRAQFAESIEGGDHSDAVEEEGRKRQVPALEIMIGTTAVRNLIREGKIHQLPGTMQVSKKDGMQTMDMALLDIVARGLVTKDEAQSRSSNPNLFGTVNAASKRAKFNNQTHICEVSKVLNLEEYFRAMVEKDSSDLYLMVARPPMYRVNGKVEASEHEPLLPRIARRASKIVHESGTVEEFRQKKELNLALSLPKISRFRVNVLRQRGSIAIVVRKIKVDIPSFATLGLPSVLRDVAMLKRGLVLVVGATGSGKSTTLASMIDLRNSNDEDISLPWKIRLNLFTNIRIGSDPSARSALTLTRSKAH